MACRGDAFAFARTRCDECAGLEVLTGGVDNGSPGPVSSGGAGVFTSSTCGSAVGVLTSMPCADADMEMHKNGMAKLAIFTGVSPMRDSGRTGRFTAPRLFFGRLRSRPPDTHSQFFGLA